MGRIVGIDLGTTTSEIAYIKNGKPEIIKNGYSGVTPSVVGFDKNMELLVGTPAKNQYVIAKERTVKEVKRKMGTSDKVLLAGKIFTPVEISSLILKELKRVGEDYLHEKITDAVITVPANFNDAQRKATKEAGEKAGLNVKRIINEPTAAALAFGIDNIHEEGKILVYDLGGGTFDVTVLEMISGSLDVLSSRGINKLGGKDFDEKISAEIIEYIKTEYDVDVSRDLKARARIIDEAEKAKITLSAAQSVEINLPYVAMKEDGPVSCEMDFTRSRYESLIRGYIDQSMAVVDEALDAARLSAYDIDVVLAVGGSSRTPLVLSRLEERFGGKIRGGVNPDEAVALGAAVQAGILGNEISGAGSIAIFDICNHSLGVEVVKDTAYGRENGYFSRIIPRDSHLPISRADTFYTESDYQTEVKINIYQGENERVENNTKLGDMLLTGVPSARAGEEAIEVTFTYNLNGMLEAQARIVSTGKRVNTTINMLSDNAPKSRFSDKAPKSKSESRDDELEWENYSLAESIRTTVSIYNSKRASLSNEKRAIADELMKKLKQAVINNDYDRVTSIDDDLMSLLLENL